MKKLTIILPTHREESFKQCIKYIENQKVDFKNIQVIILADTNADYVYKHKQYIIEKMKNIHEIKGFNAFLNCIKILEKYRTTSEYFWFIEDDVFLKNEYTLAVIMLNLKQNLKVNVVDDYGTKLVEDKDVDDMCSYIFKFNVSLSRIYELLLKNGCAIFVDILLHNIVSKPYKHLNISIYSQMKESQNNTTNEEFLSKCNAIKYRKISGNELVYYEELGIINYILLKYCGFYIKEQLYNFTFKDILNYFRFKKDFNKLKEFIISKSEYFKSLTDDIITI